MKIINDYNIYKTVIEFYSVNKWCSNPKIAYHDKLGWLPVIVPFKIKDNLLLLETIKSLQKEVEPLELASKEAWITITKKYKLTNN